MIKITPPPREESNITNPVDSAIQIKRNQRLNASMNGQNMLRILDNSNITNLEDNQPGQIITNIQNPSPIRQHKRITSRLLTGENSNLNMSNFNQDANKIDEEVTENYRNNNGAIKISSLTNIGVSNNNSSSNNLNTSLVFKGQQAKSAIKNDQQSQQQLMVVQAIQLTNKSNLKVSFAEDDIYCFFVKGSIIDDTKHKEKETTPKIKHTNPAKKILLELKKPENITKRIEKEDQTLLQSVPTPDGLKNENTSIQMQNISGISPLLTDNNTNMSEIKMLKSGLSGDVEKYDENHQANLTIFKHLQSRQSFMLPKDGQKGGNIVRRNSLGGFKTDFLEKYEKQDYIRRLSDTKKISEFQQKQASQILHRLSRLLQGMGWSLMQIIGLGVIATTRPSSFSCISNSTHNMFTIFLNISLIGVLIFIYPISLFFYNQYNILDTPLNGLGNNMNYSGHSFIILCGLSILRFSIQVKDFSLSQKEKQSFKLIFTELKWNIPKPQGHVMAEKARLVDQILENIADNDSDKLIKQIVWTFVGQLCLTILNLIVMFYVLDDSKLYVKIESLTGKSESDFLIRFVIALATSSLMLLNNYIMKQFYQLLECVAFTFYERNQFYLLFFNQMLILILYEVKVLGYINSAFSFSFIVSNKQLLNIAELNYVLAISEITIYIIEALAVFFSAKLRRRGERKRRSTSIFPFETLQNQPQVEDISEQSKSESNDGEIAVTIAATSQIPTDTSKNARIAIGASQKGFQDDLTKFEKVGENKQITQGSFRHMRKCIFIISFNLLIINGAILSPPTFLFGLLVNSLFILHFSYEQKLVMRHIAYLDFNQFNSQASLLALLSLLFAFFFNFTIGFTNISSLDSQFKNEFSYFYNTVILNTLVEISTMPQFLYPIILILSVILIQSFRQHQNTYQALNDSYSELRAVSFNEKKALN